MESLNFLDIFQGINTLVQGFSTNPTIAFGRIFLIALGLLLFYLGRKGVLEALLMIPMGLGMATVNAALMFFDPLKLHGGTGTLFVEAQAGATADALKNAAEVMTVLQIDWLQPIYTLTFSNGLIACLIFMGIGVLLDVGFVMARPFQSMFIALCAELGTIVVFPLAVAIGLTQPEAASAATIGGADGPMVLFTSLILAKHLFVPITVVGYLYLGLAYGSFPYLIKWLVPEKLRGINMAADTGPKITRAQKLLNREPRLARDPRLQSLRR